MSDANAIFDESCRVFYEREYDDETEDAGCGVEIANLGGSAVLCGQPTNSGTFHCEGCRAQAPIVAASPVEGGKPPTPPKATP